MELETSRVLQPDFVAGLLIPEESSSTHIYEDEEIYHVMQLPIADEMLLDIQSLDEDKIHHLKLPEMQNKLIVLDIYQGPVGGIHEAKPPSDAAVGPFQIKYLVGCANGSLLMLVRHFTPELFPRTYKFDIYELKNEKEWSRLDSLENYVLMIGLNSSVQMLPASIQTKGNQIYFTDNLLELKAVDYAEHQDIGIFDLGTMEVVKDYYPMEQQQYAIWHCIRK
ncbi:hypothetical protein HN51_041322 [Arachis hypogaea]